MHKKFIIEAHAYVYELFMKLLFGIFCPSESFTLSECGQEQTCHPSKPTSSIGAVYRPVISNERVKYCAVATLHIATDDTLPLIRRIQITTIVWMCIEAALSLWSAWKAQSPALLAFGGDSAVELLSAVVVLRRFRRHASPDAEKHAARIAGSLLFVLAGCVILISLLTLGGYSEPKPSYLGIAVLAMAALIMPWLASKKRHLSRVTGSAAMRADAAQSAACFYLSIVALLGLLIHAMFHIALADPVAALVITPLLWREGREAIRGKACGCC